LNVARAGRRDFRAVAAALVVASLLGCADAGPSATVTAVKPTRAYSDVAVPLTIQAPGLRAGLFVDVTGQTATFDDSTVHAWLMPSKPDLPTISLDPVRWHYIFAGQSFFRATVPAGMDADVYALRMEAPNGRQATLANAFEELGPDAEAPNISLGAPAMDQTFPPVGTALAVFSADDGLGQLAEVRLETQTGEVLRCPADVDPDTGLSLPRKACVQPFHAPPLPEDVPSMSFWVQAIGIDVAGNLGASDLVELRVAQVPKITAFMPTLDQLNGGALMTLTGRYFFEDALALVGGMPLVDQVRSGDTSITGRVPPSMRPGTVNVEVQSATGLSKSPGAFRYVGPPRIRSVHPSVGPTAGGIKMTIAGNDLRDAVKISFGASSSADAVELLMPVTHEADDKVTGCLPPGHGTVTVWATDPITGVSYLDAAFTYTDGPPDPSWVSLCDPSRQPAPPP